MSTHTTKNDSEMLMKIFPIPHPKKRDRGRKKGREGGREERE